MRSFIKGLIVTATLTISAIGNANAANYYISTDAQTGITRAGMGTTYIGGYFYNFNGLEGKLGDHRPGGTFVTENTNIYFVFDLSVLTSAGIHLNNLSQATLTLSSSSTYTPTDDFYFSIYDVSTSMAELIAPQKDRTDIFEDLQSGTKFGSVKVAYDAGYGYYEISFNQDGINSLKSTNGLFAIGGSFNQWLQQDYDTAYMRPDDGAWGLELQFTTPVPEPETYGMLLAGIGLITIAKRRRH